MTHIDDDTLVALALGEVTPPEREELSAHLAGCGACRSEYQVIEDAVRHSLAAAPAIAPPAGFSGRVVSAMAPDRDRLASSGGSPKRWTPWLAAAAALVVGIGVGAGTIFAVLGAGTPVIPGAASTASPTAGPAEPGASALVTRTGETVGTAGLTTIDGRQVLVLTVIGGRPGMTYECVLVGADGSRTSGGTWTLGAGYGGTEGRGAWAVPMPAIHVDRVELIGPSGNVWSTAHF